MFGFIKIILNAFSKNLIAQVKIQLFENTHLHFRN